MLYLDNASTTPTDPKVVQKMLPYFSEQFGNPSSIYSLGLKAKKALDEARETIANFLSAEDEDEIIFTSGGTESDNLAILGAARVVGSGHIITTQIEHPAVLESCKQLKKEGFAVSYLPVSKMGIVDPEDVKKALRPNTILVSIMYANNEIGTIQPITEISKIVDVERKKRIENCKLKIENCKNIPIFLHCDACQAAGYLDMNVAKLGVDLLTFNGSKIYGPKGIGALFVKSGVKLAPIMLGGHQQTGLRPGTENVPAIIGLATAVKLIGKNHAKEESLRNHFIAELLKIENSELNGDPSRRLPNNINISFKDVEGEAAELYLDKEDIACSTGSACLSQTFEPSHVVLALGKSREVAHCSLRFTIGKHTIKSELDAAIIKIRETIEKLREISILSS